MRVQVAGRQIDVGEALRSRIEGELAAGVRKYFPHFTEERGGEASVTVARGATGFEVDCTVHLPSGINLHAEGAGGDAHSAFDDALQKLEKRVRRYKRRLKNHHVASKSPLPAEDASAYVLAPIQEDEESETAQPNGADHAPLVIAETTVSLRTMPVAMAVLQLELLEHPVLLFRNAGTGGINLVYRRPDGNVGWIDPDRAGVKAH
jgi:ribosomal subunit interface protein